MTANTNRGLIGKFFHSLDEKDPSTLCWQGQVLSRRSPSHYLVQLYDFICGQPSDQVLVSIDQMQRERWTFYSTREEWGCAYEAYDRRKTREDIQQLREAKLAKETA